MVQFSYLAFFVNNRSAGETSIGFAYLFSRIFVLHIIGNGYVYTPSIDDRSTLSQ